MTQMDKYTPLHLDNYPFNYTNLKQNKMTQVINVDYRYGSTERRKNLYLISMH